MTICASVKSRDGIVLGTDSMTQVVATLPDGEQAVISSYSNARKLFQIEELPIGVFTYGAGNLGSRTIYSLVVEYSDNIQSENVQDVAKGLSEFVLKVYNGELAETPDANKPVLGLYVGGYSPGTTLPEEWEVKFPQVTEPIPVRPTDGFGASWRGIELPFARLHNGFDPRMLDLLASKGVPEALLREVAQEKPFGAQVIFDSMPVQDAIDFATHILRTTIEFASFEIGPTPCGGQLQVAAITLEDGFQWVNEPQFRLKGNHNE